MGGGESCCFELKVGLVCPLFQETSGLWTSSVVFVFFSLIITGSVYYIDLKCSTLLFTTCYQLVKKKIAMLCDDKLSF